VTKQAAKSVASAGAGAAALSPERRLSGFIAKFSPENAAMIRAVRRAMRVRLPSAIEMVYDNYNFLVIGYSPTERPSDAIFSIAAQARGLTLFFLQGAGVPDPGGLLRGSGKIVRGMRLESAATLDRPEVRTLMKEALRRAKRPMNPRSVHRVVIRAVAVKQRPRRLDPA
jgi:hypothetical protein